MNVLKQKQNDEDFIMLIDDKSDDNMSKDYRNGKSP